MTIIEKRLVSQDWYETEFSKTGFESHGWIFKDDRTPLGEHWEITEFLDTDKFGNPILGIAEREHTI